MKSLIIKWVLPTVIDLLIKVLIDLSTKSTNEIDDRIVEVIKINRQEIMDEIKKL